MQLSGIDSSVATGYYVQVEVISTNVFARSNKVSSLYWLARTAVGISGVTPRPLRYGLGSAISAVSYLGWRSKRLHTQQNMSKVLGLPVDHPQVKRLAFASWRNYGRPASDLIYFPHVNMDRIEAGMVDQSQGGTWQEYARRALSPGKGAIVASAHFGSWDMAGAVVARSFPVSAIAEMFQDQRLNDLIQGSRRAKNVEIIPMENSARRILQDLHRNRFVAIVVDRPMSREQGIAVSFFGHPTYVSAGPAALALKCGAAVLPGLVWYGPGGRFYVRAFAPDFPRECATPEERTQEIARLTQYMYSALEEVIREWPEQWFMFRPFWPTDPPAQE